MTATVDVLQDDIMKAMGDFIALLLPTLAIIRAQQNRVATPVGDFVAMNPNGFTRLSTNLVPAWSKVGVPAQTQRQQKIQYSIMLDFYGGSAEENAIIVSTMFRDSYGCDFFSGVETVAGEPFDIAPLYADEPSQLPTIDAEQQFEERWNFAVYLQVNPIVTVPQQYATAVSVDLINVDVAYLNPSLPRP